MFAKKKQLKYWICDIMKSNDVFKVDEIEAINFDENGKEDGTWNGFSVVKRGDEANYCFDMRNKINADQLCDFLNNECIEIDDSIDAFVLDNCIEWSNIITTLEKSERNYFHKKETYQALSDKIIEVTDFKELYGKNNADVRKNHVKNELADQYHELKELEFKIDNYKRRISFLKSLVSVKTALLEVKKHD